MIPRPIPLRHCVTRLTLLSFPNLCLILVFAISCAHVPAQTVEQPDDEVLRVSTDLLLFPVRIRDKSGRAATGITERDLFLKDEDHVTSGIYFSQGIDRVAFVFALDRSGSLREIISQQSGAALALYQHFNEKSSIAVLHFAGTATIAAPFLRDPSQVRPAFTLNSRPNQRTAIFDAAAKSVAMFDALPRVRTERRIVVLISDGLDNASSTKADAVISDARRKRISFYVIHLPLFEPRDGRLAVRRPTKGFRELAEKTGGKFFVAGGSALEPIKDVNLTPIFQAIEEDLRSQYLLGFYLNEKANDGARHVFSLSVPQGFEYQLSPRDFSRTQNFFVARPREALKNPS